MPVTTNKRYYLRIILLLILFSCTAKLGFASEDEEQTGPVISSVSINSCVGSITISVTSGVLPYTYEWKDNGGTVLPFTSFIASGLTAGNYTVEVTDGNGDSTGPATYTVTNPPDLVGTVVVNDVTCRGDSDAQIVVTMGNGNPGYDWELFNGSMTSIGTGSIAFPNNVITITGLGIGNYTLRTADQDGCTGDIVFTVTQPANFLGYSIGSSTDATCFNSADGSITATGTGGWGAYTYQWIRLSDNAVIGTAATITGLAAGDYRLDIIDRGGTGCTISTPTLTINSPPEIIPTASISNALCNGDANGSIDLSVTGGVAPYSYSWSNGATTQDISGLAAGAYTVTITDNAGCTDVETFTVTEPAVLTINPVITDVDCFGDNTGRIQSNVSGGTGPYIYAWSTGNTSTNLNNRVAGTYSLTVTDANGCVATAVGLTVSQPAMALSKLSDVQTDPACFGNSDGSITITMQGGTAPYSYLWSNGDNTATATGLNAGIHSVTVTDANGCTYMEAFTLTDPARIAVAPVLTLPTCNGGADGAITVSASNGTGPYTYNWNTGDSGPTITGLVAGTYTVTVSDAGGCSVMENIVLGEPAVLVGNATVNNISCNGSADGSVFLAVSGGTGPYTYSWNTGATTNNITGLSAGAYSVTITDAAGCAIVENYNIIDPAPIGVAFTQTNILCKGASTGGIDITPSGGTAPYSYLWSNGATTQDLTNVAAGNYSVTVRDASSCAVVLNVTITEPALVLNLSGTQTNATCNGSNNGSIDVTVTGGAGPYSYAWNTGAITEDVTGLAPGNYSVSVTDANGCIKSIGFTITEPAPLAASPSKTDITCNGANDGAINVSVSGGTGPYTYAWADDGSITTSSRSGLNPGNYTVTVTDANGCMDVESITIIEPAQLTSSDVVQNVSCFGESTGAINLSISGGVAPYSFSWSNGALTEDLVNIPAGNYSVVITDVNGCTINDNFTITQPSSALSKTEAVQQITCNGAADGIINLTVTGGSAPYTYNWSNGSTSEDLNSLPAGSYSVTITDNNGCTINDTYVITDPPVLVLSGTKTDVSCFGADDGTVDITVSGGEAPYTFAWSNGETTEDVTSLAPGNYTVNITDARGCTTNQAFNIVEPSALSLGYAVNNVSCFGLANGSIDITVSGGSAPYSYSWSNASTSEDITGLIADDYIITVTDVNGCSLIETITVTQPVAALSTTEVVTDISCFGGSDGSIQLTPAGGTAPYTYSWNTGSTNKDIFGLSDGSYQVTITDANGCSIVENYTISMPIALQSSGTQVNVLCNGDNTGSIDLTVTGGTGAYTYTWSNGSTTEDLSNIVAGSYTVTIADARGCSINRSFTITQPLALNVVDNIVDVACFGDGDGSIDISVSGGIAPYTYSWSGGETTQDLFNLTGGSYTLTVTDANGCQSVNTYTVNEPTAALAVSGLVTDENCFGDSQGAVQLTVTGGSAPYSYSWNQGSTTKDVSGLGRGTYQVTVTDNNGCVIQENFTIGGPAAITAAAIVNDVTCNGNGDGSIDLSPSGGVGPYTYLWADGVTTEDRSGLSPANYGVTITDANGCSTFRNYVITQPTALIVTESINDVACFGDNNGSIDISVSGGIAPYTYSWSSGETTQDLISLSGGSYTLTVTDANGCQSVNTYTVNEPTAALAVAGIVTDENCFGDSQGAVQLTVTGGTAPYSYSWNQGSTTKDVSGLGRGTYQVTVTDNNGCVIQGDFTIGGPAALSATAIVNDVTCNGIGDGSIDLSISGGVGPYTFLWADGATTEDRTGLIPANYGVTITDANGCSTFQNYTITEPASILIGYTANDVNCFGDGNGSIAVSVTGGTLPYTYAWSSGQTTKDLTGISGGSYTLTVTDNNGCQTSETIVVAEPSAPLASTAVITDETCFGDNQGAVVLNVTGGTAPYSYSWNQGSSSKDIFGLSQGTYQVTITDNNGCSIQQDYTVSGPSAISLSADVSTISCNGAGDGSIDLTVAGGTGPFTFAWSNGSTNEDLNTLTPGTYAVLVTDVGGCTYSANYTITEPLQLSTNFLAQNVTCFGADDGSIDVTVSGGTLPYTYNWDNGATTEDISGLAGGNYELMVTDARGCVLTTNIAIGAPSAPLGATATITNTLCNGQPNGIVELAVTGGTAPFNYLWSNGSNQRDLVNVFAGSYAVTITDASGCVFTETYVVGEPDALDIVFDATSTSCFGDSDGSIIATASGGTGPYSYVWSNGSTSKDLVNISGGTYNLTIVDSNNCSITRSVEVGDSRDLTVEIQKQDVLCKGASTGFIQLDVTGGSGSYTYTWNTGQTTDQLVDLNAGVYEVLVSDAGGCSTTASIVIAEPAEALTVALADYEDLLCFGDQSGVISALPQGGIGPYTYLWSNGERTSRITGLGAGTYSVAVTDANGCLVQQSVTIAQPAAPITIATSGKLNLSCLDDGDGSINIDVTGGTGPYEYLWSTGDRGTSIANLSAGDYTVRVKDANDCVVERIFTVTEPELLSLEDAVVNESQCYDDRNGSIELNIKGGTGPYTYQWNTGAVTKNLIGISSGTYDVLVTDANGCQVQGTYTLAEPELYRISPEISPISCVGANDASISLNIEGGIEPIAIRWSTGASTETLTNLSPGVYNVLVTDKNGCTIQNSFNIFDPLPLTLDAYIEDATRCNDPQSGRVNVIVSGGQEPYQYRWTNGATESSLIDVLPGTYVVEVTDRFGCTVQGTYTVLQPEPLQVGFSTEPYIDCENRIAGTLVKANVKGGVGNYRYRWSRGGGTRSEFLVTDGGRISIEVSDDRGCFRTRAIDIDIPELGTADFEYNAESIDLTGELASNDPVSFFDLSVGEVVDWKWEFGDGFDSDEIDPIHTYDAPGTYEVLLTVTDRTGCQTVKSTTLEITEGYRIMVPTAFTPNNDGNNDFFRPRMLGLTKVRLIIYNTWGEVIFSTDDVETKGWDGTVKGKRAENGNYVFKLIGVSFNGLKVEREGIFALMK
ncbi:hypothetical protein BFP97_15135 [Roseivirga sp. 4D4]|uniref:PKD domain-containing protein n=1 Tax=Roseivirga sp. 4D4 TaxID=1889784 RepID=UPI0008529F6E|nr:PKD domain-containing protein [Roseivirga sp. 4D4]OEK02778.1 hypothetical protein BFP97_15135 [Roseivirga sp. 4D4]